MIQKMCKNRTLCLALLQGLSPHRQGCASLLPYKCNSLQLSFTLMKIHRGLHLRPNSGLICTSHCSKKKLTTLRSTCLDEWAPLSKTTQSPSRMEHQTAAFPRNQPLGTSEAHFSVMGVSAFGQECLHPKAAHCQIQQFRGFYLQRHSFPFLCFCIVN